MIWHVAFIFFKLNFFQMANLSCMRRALCKTLPTRILQNMKSRTIWRYLLWYVFSVIDNYLLLTSVYPALMTFPPMLSLKNVTVLFVNSTFATCYENDLALLSTVSQQTNWSLKLWFCVLSVVSWWPSIPRKTWAPALVDSTCHWIVQPRRILFSHCHILMKQMEVKIMFSSTFLLLLFAHFFMSSYNMIVLQLHL